MGADKNNARFERSYFSSVSNSYKYIFENNFYVTKEAALPTNYISFSFIVSRYNFMST
jgi:hypothetical protein